jgi:hypothetical protein
VPAPIVEGKPDALHLAKISTNQQESRPALSEAAAQLAGSSSIANTAGQLARATIRTSARESPQQDMSDG